MTEVTVSQQDLEAMCVYVADVAYEMGEKRDPVICRKGQPVMSLSEWVLKGVGDFVRASQERDKGSKAAL